MNLFMEKVRQNRALKKSDGRCMLILAPPQWGKTVLNIIEQHTRVISVMRMQASVCRSVIEAVAKDFKPVLIDSHMSLEQLKHQLAHDADMPSAVLNDLMSAHGLFLGFMIDLSSSKEEFLAVDLLLHRTPSPLRLAGVYSGHDSYYPLYEVPGTNKPATRATNKPIAIVTDWFCGYGDAVMMFSYIQQFIDSKHRAGTEVHLITRRKTARFFDALLTNCRVVTIAESYHLYEAVVRSGRYSEVRFIPLRSADPPTWHVTDICTRALELGNPLQLPHPDVQHLPSLAPEAERLINGALEDRIAIGVQFRTADELRSWPDAHAASFVDTCRRVGYAVVNLTPDSPLFEGMVDASFVPVEQLFHVIARLHAIVAIDSVCGHIAGLLGVPNLTLWGRNAPGMQKPTPETRSYVSFRTLSRNYSLVAKDLQASSISPDLVFQRLQQMLAGTIASKTDRITIRDTLGGKDIEWVGGDG